MDPNQISIEAGCIYIGKHTWEYRWGDNDGQHAIRFQSSIQPKIGDTIENGTLIVRTAPKINADYSKWIPSQEEVWPTNKMFDTPD